LVVIEPGGNTNGVLQHKGEEVGYVVEGQLELTINSEVRLLNAGDSFYFPSNLPHAYRNPGKTRLRVVWINTPPTF
jgi:quercetin dioxygenase-like cupin family protein